MLPNRVKANQISVDKRKEMIESMAEMMRAYVSGDHFEDRLHKIVCDWIGYDVDYNPTFPEGHVPSREEEDAQALYYNTYAILQHKIVATATVGL